MAYRKKYPRAKITKIKAAFDPHGMLHLDGGEILFSRKAPLAEFYAHETTHAIDGTDHAISGTEDWKKAWRKEIAEPEFSARMEPASQARDLPSSVSCCWQRRT